MSNLADTSVNESDAITILASLFAADLLRSAAQKAGTGDPQTCLRMTEAQEKAFSHHDPARVSLGHIRSALLEARGRCDDAQALLVDTLVSAAGQLVNSLHNHGDHRNASRLTRTLHELFLENPGLPVTPAAASLLSSLSWQWHYQS